MDLAPELNVRLVVETDQKRERINARNSVIYAVDGETLILSQTEPSITSSLLNKEIMVTYLLQKNDKYSRYSFSALVTELIDQYELKPDQHVRAIAVCKRSEAKPYEMRMCYRAGPSSKSGLDASILGTKVNVVDISLGGIKFSYGEVLRLETDKVIEVRLGIAGEIYPVQARVVRIWRTERERFKSELRFAGAEFLNVSGKTEQELSRKIRDIERESSFVSDKL